MKSFSFYVIEARTETGILCHDLLTHFFPGETSKAWNRSRGGQGKKLYQALV